MYFPIIIVHYYLKVAIPLSIILNELFICYAYIKLDVSKIINLDKNVIQYQV